MKKRNLLIIAVILAVVAGLTQVINKRDTPSTDPELEKPLVDADIISSIDEIVIQKSDAVVHLHKKSDSWLVLERNDFPADKEQLIDLLENLSTYSPASLTSKDADRHAHFKVVNPTSHEGKDENVAGTLISLRSGGKPIFELVVGKYRQSSGSNKNAPPTDDGTYVRKGKNPNVYLIKENLRVVYKPDDWVKLDLFTANEKEIKQILFEVPEDRFIIEREKAEDTLTVEHDEAIESIDTYAVNTLVEELNPFTIEEILPRTSQLDQRLELKSEIMVKLFDETSIRFQIYGETRLNLAKEGDDKEETTYYATILPSADLESEKKWGALGQLSETWQFKMNEWRAKEWVKKRSDVVQPKK